MMEKVFEVFTKEYKRETDYQEFAFGKIQDFKLKNKSESIETKIKRLTDKEFVSNFKISVGDY